MIRRLLQFFTQLRARVSPPEPAAIEPAAKTSKTFHDAAVRRIETQVRQIDSIQQKASAAFAAGSVIFPAALGLILVSERAPLPEVAQYPLAAAALSYVVLAIVGGAAYWPSAAFNYPPDLPTLEQHNANYDEESLQLWVALEITQAVKDNQGPIDRRLTLTAWALVMLGAESISLVIAVSAVLAARTGWRVPFL